jgi:Flp pilus assembly pilin Flp
MSSSIFQPALWPHFELGDRVVLHSGLVGIIVGIRYGKPAYDVRVQGTCLRNVRPEQIRLAVHPAIALAARRQVPLSRCSQFQRDRAARLKQISRRNVTNAKEAPMKSSTAAPFTLGVRGSASISYALLAALISAAVIPGAMAVEDVVSSLMHSINTRIEFLRGDLVRDTSCFTPTTIAALDRQLCEGRVLTDQTF